MTVKTIKINQPITNYKDLRVWQEGIELVREVYTLCGKLPKSEMFGLANQMKRAAVSIPSNIAEGHSRSYRTEYRQYTYIAVGSLAELETQLHITKTLLLLDNESLAPVFARVDRLRAMLVTLARRLS